MGGFMNMATDDKSVTKKAEEIFNCDICGKTVHPPMNYIKAQGIFGEEGRVCSQSCFQKWKKKNNLDGSVDNWMTGDKSSGGGAGCFFLGLILYFYGTIFYLMLGLITWGLIIVTKLIEKFSFIRLWSYMTNKVLYDFDTTNFVRGDSTVTKILFILLNIAGSCAYLLAGFFAACYHFMTVIARAFSWVGWLDFLL